MNTDKPIESLESWLSGKPYWEQYVWKINIEKDSLTDEDVAQCYQYLSEHLGLIGKLSDTKPPISFKSALALTPESSIESGKIKILEIKDIKNVNALKEDCAIKFGPNLTLIYGGNGSGKSGIGRLLCNACFSRGDREILPNIKNASTIDTQAQATFVMADGLGNVTEIKYSFSDNNDELKCFYVFDSKSILIHLDQSNNVNFTPAQIIIFDKVADTISKLEERLNNEKNERKKDNPFQVMFLDGATSETALFCNGITGATKESEFLKHANFDDKVDKDKIVKLQKQIEEKKKLDIPKKKLQLAMDRQSLGALKASLQNVINLFSFEKTQEALKLVRDIIEKKRIIKSLSVQSFDDGRLKTIGSSQWKTLISAAKTLYESEKAAAGGNNPYYCMLCHQTLSKDAESLFQKYWQFLESKAESELFELTRQQSVLLQNLQTAKITFPKFLTTDAGVKVLDDEYTDFLSDLKIQFVRLNDILGDWISKIEDSQEVNSDNVLTIDLNKIDAIVSAKANEEFKLSDSPSELLILTNELNSLKHKKEVTAIKDAGLEYIAFLNWESKASDINFAGIKMAITKKRTESFLVGVALNYKGIFNQELVKLGCDFNLIMNTSGEQGNTVKEYRLEFAEDYNPSQILSEGEQNACSLADFLTEVQLDKNNCGIIFDDPVTSLDHDRKDKIALRLALEAKQRQVIIFTHDLVFMSQLVKHAEQNEILIGSHWMRKVNGIPGCVEDNASPKLANLASLKKDFQEAVQGFESLGPKEQEIALGAAFSYLRSACEALIEEMLFAGTIRRYDDHVKVQNLEEVIFDQKSALKIVDMHGRISSLLLAHNRSDLQRENPATISNFTAFKKEFDELERSLKELRKTAVKDRDDRKKTKISTQTGW